MPKINKVDAAAMNHLFKIEASRRGVKLASEDPVAIEDHKEYLAILDEVMKEDKTQSFNPNDELLD